MAFDIKNISADKFSINGRQFFKTFIPQYVNESSIRIVNVYDSGSQLATRSSLAEFTVDSVSYVNANDLINALVPVLFSKAVSGGLSDAQIEQNRLAIIELQNGSSPSGHDHDSLYYTKAQVQALLNQIVSSSDLIGSGIVDGTNLIFKNDLGTPLFTVDVGPFMSQGVSARFSNGVLTLKNASGQVLSTTSISAGKSVYDSFTFKGQLATGSDINNITATDVFEVYEVDNTGVFYFLIKENAFHDFQNSRVEIYKTETKIDVQQIVTPSGRNFSFFPFGAAASSLTLDQEYDFNTWLYPEGSSSGKVEASKVYDDINELLADQANQSVDDTYIVIDASDDTNIDLQIGKTAYYRLNSSSLNSAISDYIMSQILESVDLSDFDEWTSGEGFNAGTVKILRTFQNKVYKLLSRGSFHRTIDIVAETNAFQWKVILDGGAGTGSGTSQEVTDHLANNDIHMDVIQRAAVNNLPQNTNAEISYLNTYTEGLEDFIREELIDVTGYINNRVQTPVPLNALFTDSFKTIQPFIHKTDNFTVSIADHNRLHKVVKVVNNVEVVDQVLVTVPLSFANTNGAVIPMRGNVKIIVASGVTIVTRPFYLAESANINAYTSLVSRGDGKVDFIGDIKPEN